MAGEDGRTTDWPPAGRNITHKEIVLSYSELSWQIAQNDQPIIHGKVDDKLHNLFPS